MKPGLRVPAVAGGLFLVAFAAGSIAASARTPTSEPVRRVAAKPPTAEQYDSATVSVRGSLTPQARERLAAVAGTRKVALVVLTASDSRKCEDLGRQLRELERSTEVGLPLVIATEPEALEELRGFVRRERVRVHAIVPLATHEVIEGMRSVPSPAVLVPAKEDAQVEGVGHPLRFANARVRSFAAELAPLVQ